jgi:citrate lyase subunit beta/citryl-CoA lyase
MPKHPSEVLLGGEKVPPIIPAAEHFAGTEDRITKAFQLQEKMGGVFDITMDLEDGAPTGAEKEHAEMVVRLQNSDLNKFNQAGVRIHDPSNPYWRQDVDIVVRGAGERVRYLTIPKSMSLAACSEVIDYIRETAAKAGIRREIPVHVLIETQAALRVVWEMAALPNVEVLDFGLMDFVSDHHGAIPSSAMKSPWQFDHALLRRAKAETVAAALANGVVPAHNVTLELRDTEFIYNDAKRARDEFGFLRQWSIYPAQIEPIVRAMAPPLPEVEEAEAILLKAYDADWGPIQHDGNLQDRATYRHYWEQLQRARVMGLPLQERTVELFFS